MACGSSSKGGGDKKNNGSSGSSGSNDSAGSGASGSGNEGPIAKDSDTKPVGTDLKIVFSPMYSGYDGGDHNFKIPAIVFDLQGVHWSASDITYVDMEEDPRPAA